MMILKHAVLLLSGLMAKSLRGLRYILNWHSREIPSKAKEAAVEVVASTATLAKEVTGIVLHVEMLTGDGGLHVTSALLPSQQMPVVQPVMTHTAEVLLRAASLHLA